MNQHRLPSAGRTVSLFRNGRNQAVRIPVEFELPGTEAIIRKDGDRLIIEPANRRLTLVEVLDSLEPCPDFPEDIDDRNLPPLRDVILE